VGLECNSGGAPAVLFKRKCFVQRSSIEARISGWSQGSPGLSTDVNASFDSMCNYKRKSNGNGRKTGTVKGSVSGEVPDLSGESKGKQKGKEKEYQESHSAGQVNQKGGREKDL
jgi:hypothetical protein